MSIDALPFPYILCNLVLYLSLYLSDKVGKRLGSSVGLAAFGIVFGQHPQHGIDIAKPHRLLMLAEQPDDAAVSLVRAVEGLVQHGLCKEPDKGRHAVAVGLVAVA